MAAAKAAKEEPPYVLWWSLDMAAQDLDALEATIGTQDGPPPPDKIVNADQVRAAIPELVAQLKSLSVGLELNGQPPSAPLTAKVSPFLFGQAVLDADGIPTEDVTTADEFAFGTQEVLVMFDYEGMTDGQEVVFKVFIDGEEDPSWRVITPWDLGAEGSANKPLSLSYSDTFVLSSGVYEVDMFVDGQLAQRGYFTVLPE